MDRLKLIQIIEKELEELKILTDEVSGNEKDNRLVIDIALSKARVLCHEMELLRELSIIEEAAPVVEQEEEEMDFSESGATEPELEIAGPDDNEEDSSTMDFGDSGAIEDDLEDEDFDEEDIDDEESIESEDEDLIDFEEENTDDDLEEIDEKIEFEAAGNLADETTEKEEEIEEEPVPEKKSVAERPVIREIPKPEPKGGSIIKEPMTKGQSLNDTIAENKAKEPSINNSGPISSLRASIGLNDRFLFVKEIFGNNTDKYNKVIDHLDKLNTIQQAVDYLKTQLTLQKKRHKHEICRFIEKKVHKIIYDYKQWQPKTAIVSLYINLIQQNG